MIRPSAPHRWKSELLEAFSNETVTFCDICGVEQDDDNVNAPCEYRSAGHDYCGLHSFVGTDADSDMCPGCQELRGQRR